MLRGGNCYSIVKWAFISTFSVQFNFILHCIMGSPLWRWGRDIDKPILYKLTQLGVILLAFLSLTAAVAFRSYHI